MSRKTDVVCRMDALISDTPNIINILLSDYVERHSEKKLRVLLGRDRAKRIIIREVKEGGCDERA